MSGLTLNTTKLQQNWTALFLANSSHEYEVDTDGATVTLTLKPWDINLFEVFGIKRTIGKKENYDSASGHITMHTDPYGFNPAHVTLVGWPDLKKTNYWFDVVGGGQVQNMTSHKLPKASDPDTVKQLSNLPTELKTTLMAFLRDVYSKSL
jgi:hypothetical protein